MMGVVAAIFAGGGAAPGAAPATRPAAATAVVAAARDVLSRHGDAIVTVSAVSKTLVAGMGRQFGQADEQPVEARGVVIDPTGLTVVPYSSLDRSAGNSGFTLYQDGEELKIERRWSLSAVKLHLADGTELPARLVLKDADLDLAFIRPDAIPPGKPIASLPLAAAPALAPLDELILVSRLGQHLDRALTVRLDRVTAVMRKPRTLYLPGDAAGTDVAAFAAHGQFVGIITLRRTRAVTRSASAAVVIVPAEDVLEVARQALAKGE